MMRLANATFDSVLDKIRSESANTVELGTKFERLVRDFFRTDKVYRNRFEQVWLWQEWEKRTTKDIGIDIVARARDGGMCAIQCKCFADDTAVDQKDVTGFISLAKGLEFDSLIYVHTSERMTRNAEKHLKANSSSILNKGSLRDSSVDWSDFPKLKARRPKNPYEYQQRAIDDTVSGLREHDRGKMIMACGTGKTLVSLHVAESLVGAGGIVLYLVPSIQLIQQSMREWSENANKKHYYIGVCSDSSAGEDASITELECPVSTDVGRIKSHIKKRPKDAMTVVFSTYHSIEAVEKSVGGRGFDLVFCDEAHRTTGVEGKSYYTRVHSDENIRAAKRLYMTATPRVYSEAIKSLGNRKGKVIFSMDDQGKYGPELHRLSFTEAVHRYKALADFKVKIAVVSAEKASADFQQAIADRDRSMPLDERTLLAAVWHGIQYPHDDAKPSLLQRVIAFSNRIDRSEMFAGAAKDPEGNDRSLEGVASEVARKSKTGNRVKVMHVDGKHRALDRRERMRWLKESNDDPHTCRILSNARCLSEGVDVPALDGVVFLNPRKSVVDVVQSVGRVMRRADGKSYGYVILPVAIPAGLKYNEALNDNKTFKVVWEVLNALRSHDEEFAREINQLTLSKSPENTGALTPRVSVSILDTEDAEREPISSLFEGIRSKTVEKVGDIDYYEKYGQKIGEAAQAVEFRIREIMKSSEKMKGEVKRLHSSLRTIINDSVSEEESVRVLAQHKVMSRVFDELFRNEFTAHNPIAVSLESIARRVGLDEETSDLREFYASVHDEVRGLRTREERQEFIKKIYENFFSSTDKKGAEKHGVVYSPVPVVDFIINSTQVLLQRHFGTRFSDRAVKILEPFAGTGTFLSRLLESGLLESENADNMYRKYKSDLLANEMILLAYYICAVNVETTYASLRRGGKYVPFEGMNYTDTLELNPNYRDDVRHRMKDTKLDETFKDAHVRIRSQRASHVHVIIGNPPYSAGQSNFNDENQNVRYPEIDGRIKNTYLRLLKQANPTLGAKNSLYDSYVRSIRWASDRIGKSGIIGFVTNASFIRSEAASGIRASLAAEFSEIWCLDLKGNQRTQGEISKKEGGKIFGSGSRAPVAITILVKNPAKKGCTIRYRDIGDYLSREEKLKIVRDAKSIRGIKNWKIIKPDRHHDWLDQRGGTRFEEYMPIGSKGTKSGKDNMSVFRIYSSGVKTNRDVWTYNSSEDELAKNMKLHIDYSNLQNLDSPKIDPKHAKWTGDLSDKLKKSGKQSFNKNTIRTTLYRPFFKQYLYFDRIFNNSIHRVPELFPENDSENLAICVPYKSIGEFHTLMTNVTPDLQVVFNGQYFPLHVYEHTPAIGGGAVHQSRMSPSSSPTSSPDSSPHSSLTSRQISSSSTTDSASRSSTTGRAAFGENILDSTLQEYRDHYGDDTITKKNIFYYIYGLFHHDGYKEKFANSLSRELPRIPMAPDFRKFCEAGQALAWLHLNYETCPRYPLGEPKFHPASFTKLSFARKKVTVNGRDKSVDDKTVLRIDGTVAYENIPEVRYRVNGRTPLEWAIDRYRITIDRDSSITNDPCTNTDIIGIIERMVYVGVESDKIITGLSKLPFEPKDWELAKTGLDAYSDSNSKPYQSKL